MPPASRNSIAEEGFVLTPVTDFSIFAGFDCGQADLNDFIQNEAERHRTELIAETYSFSYTLDDGGVYSLAYISLSNDAIKREDLPKKVLQFLKACAMGRFQP